MGSRLQDKMISTLFFTILFVQHIIAAPQNSDVSCSSTTCVTCLSSCSRCDQCNLCVFCFGSVIGPCAQCKYCSGGVKVCKRTCEKGKLRPQCKACAARCA